MPSNTFDFSHVMIIAISIVLIFFLKKVNLRSKRRIIRYLSITFEGVIIGILISYVLAHILTPLIGGLLLKIKGGTEDRIMLFWFLFIGTSFLGVITGGLLGLFIETKKERGL